MDASVRGVRDILSGIDAAVDQHERHSRLMDIHSRLDERSTSLMTNNNDDDDEDDGTAATFNVSHHSLHSLPRASLSDSDTPHPTSVSSSSSMDSPVSPSITPTLFHSRLKTYLFQKSFPP